MTLVFPRLGYLWGEGLQIYLVGYAGLLNGLHLSLVGEPGLRTNFHLLEK